MTTTQSTPPSLAELEAAHAAALAAFHTAHRDAWNAAVLRAYLLAADAHRDAWADYRDADIAWAACRETWAAFRAARDARDAAWNAAVLRADLNSAWDADDDAHRAAWNAAVRRAALDKEMK